MLGQPSRAILQWLALIVYMHTLAVDSFLLLLLTSGFGNAKLQTA